MSDTMIALLLGFIEGLTEFLPVSSTGHLILAGELVGFTDNSSVAFKIAIQLGAILAILLVYWRRFWAVGTGLLKMEAGPVAFTRNILLGFAPALVIGVVA
jgi:undecaprenyl-diphosphatase